MTYTFDPSQAAFIRHKSKKMQLGVISNLQQYASHVPYALNPQKSPRKGTVVVVGAGPSLSRTGHLLPKFQKEGAFILTVNTALAAVSKFCVPDGVIARESINVSEHLFNKSTGKPYPVKNYILDLGASPDIWQSVLGICQNDPSRSVSWFLAGALQNFELGMQLDVPLLFGGSAALTSCVSLAKEWNARQIVLLGVDLAFAPDGSGYATNSAWQGYTAQVDERSGLVSISGDGFDKMKAQSESSNIKAPPQRQLVAHVHLWGKSRNPNDNRTAPSLYTWFDQLNWLTTFATRNAKNIRLVDATGEGAHKPGWIEEQRVESMTKFQKPEPISVNTNRVKMALTDIQRQCLTVYQMAATVSDPDGHVVAVTGYADGSDVVEAVAASGLLAAKDPDENNMIPSIPQVIQGTCDAFSNAALEVLAIVAPSILAQLQNPPKTQGEPQEPSSPE